MSKGPSSTADQSEFSDADVLFYAKGDQTKRVAFDLSGITTGNKRTWTAPDKSGTVAMTSDITIPADFTGDSGSGGVHGLVPAPVAGDAAAGKVLGAGGGWVNAGMTLLGTLTATSGATQSLTGLTLTSYKYLLCVVKGVSQSSTGTLGLALGSGGTPTYGSTLVLTGAGTAASTFDGVVYIYGVNQTNQQQMAAPALAMNGANATAFSYAGFIATGTAAVCNAVRFLASTGSFDAGTIDIYGVT